jgi:hypothetical protein
MALSSLKQLRRTLRDGQFYPFQYGAEQKCLKLIFYQDYYFLYQQFLLNSRFTGSQKLINYSQISYGVIKNQE